MSRKAERFWLMPLKCNTPLPCEYAKCKNRHRRFRECDVVCALEGVLPSAFREKVEMTDDPSSPATPDAERKKLTPAAQRALAEAEARRTAAAADAPPRPKELQGPKGPEPTRYGDWERKGIASDF
jgi:hypothetical protein